MKLYKTLILLISIFLLNSCTKIDTWTYKNYKAEQFESKEKNLKIFPKIPLLSKDFKESKICCRYDLLHHLGFFLNREEEKKLKAAVYFALNKTNDFEVVSWKNKNMN